MDDFEVLFVDDDLTLAEGYARVVRNQLHVRTHASDSFEESLVLVARNAIRVVVIDQRMPEITGTELMRRIHQLDQRVRVIILSGRAGESEIIEAYEDGVTKFLRKDSWRSTLVGTVQDQLLEYEAELTSSFNAEDVGKPLFEVRVGLPLLGERIAFYLLSREKLDDAFVSPSSWHSFGNIDAGVEKEITYEVEWKETEEEISKSSVTLGSEIGVTAGKLTKLASKLKADITESHEFKTVTERRSKTTARTKVSLPAEPSDPNQVHVAARSYEVAPVFFLVRSLLLSHCSTCQHKALVKIDSYIPSSRYASRQIDYLSDGSSPRVTLTGIHDVSA
ncbi:response regulator transcription factor [Winogradskya humida]|uniref:Response regulatory domain-containing protein n=1 Tax=Winogradskya humida TaxID=113566 RepID=A0ABQ3ZGG0_9ACTN|nr:response regulator [Actinoplanes humidus]GIE17664.1 hypothetical protein Ahu01nite_007660 [Actinoplanes humidus]